MFCRARYCAFLLLVLLLAAPGRPLGDIALHDSIIGPSDRIAYFTVPPVTPGAFPSRTIRHVSGAVAFSPLPTDVQSRIEVFVNRDKEAILARFYLPGGGRFVVDGLEPGLYAIEIGADGYQTDRATLGDCDLSNDSLEDQIVILHAPAYRAFHGNLHSHTGYSDGWNTPRIAYAFARDVARVDFLAVTDHDTLLTSEEFTDTQVQARAATIDGTFVGLYGYEYTRDYGHISILEYPEILPPLPLDDFYREAAERGIIGKFCHPGRYLSFCQGLPYSAGGDGPMRMMEVRDAIEEDCYLTSLRRGWHVGAEGSQDNHLPNWGNGPSYIGVPAWTGLWSETLTRDGIMDAYNTMRSFSTNDHNLEVSFWINRHGIGDRFQTSSAEAVMEAQVFDPDASDTLKSVDFFQDGVILASAHPSRTTFGWKGRFAPPNDTREHFYLIRVEQEDGDHAWTSPIWATFAIPTEARSSWRQYD